ncbi:MAG: PrsW family glutamic-type intramembrane protease [Methanoregula sp.]|jgi:RsiW-degrading membrane proteinase PrsW (M82 family)
MDYVVLLAYFLPILFLMAFIGRVGKKYIIYILWGFLTSIPMIFLISVCSVVNPQLDYDIINKYPLLEEFFKALPIIIPALIGIKNNNKDLLVCAMASGIGFSIVENWFSVVGIHSPQLGEFITSSFEYLSVNHTLEDIFGVLDLSFTTSLMHGCTSGIIGYGAVLIRNFDRHVLPTLLFGFYTIAVTIHAIFNLLIILSLKPYSQEIASSVIFIFPVFLFFFLHACYRVDIPILFKKNAME